MKIFRYTSIIFCLIFFADAAKAQLNGCDGKRYRQEVFTETKVTTVKYGRNEIINFNKDTLDLMMDIYEPLGDVTTQRPAIVLAFGGAFISGDRTQLSDLGRYYARLGYVAACIDYRTYPIFLFGFPDSTAILDVVFKAISDMKASIRYIRSVSNQFKIDTNMVFVGGVSAGAITAIHSTYLHADDSLSSYLKPAIAANGGFQGNSNNATLKYSSRVSGVLNLSGAIFDLSWIRVGDPPMASMQGTADNVVPYTDGKAAGLVTVKGSGLIHPVLKSKKIKEVLVSVPGGMHTDIYFEAPFKPYLDSFTVYARKLFADIVCNQIISSNPIVIKTNISIYPNPASDFIIVAGDQKLKSVRLYDMLGRMVPASVDGNRIDLKPNLAIKINAGIYVLVMKFENGSIGTAKVSVR